MSIKKMLKKNPVVILDGARRTPRADILINNKVPGLFHRYTANQLGGMAIKAALKASGLDLETIGHVVMGNALESHRDSIYGARGMALNGGVPIEVPALTVRRICGSGAQAVVNGAQMALLGDHPGGRPMIVVGGGESMQYPHMLYNLRGRKQGSTTVKYGGVAVHQLARGTVAQDLLHMALFDPHAGMAMANTAENLARIHNITRSEADAFAYRSHVRALAAQQEGAFAEEMTPVEVPVTASDDSEMLMQDTHPRPNISMDGLAKLPPVFEPPDGIITPGNASGVVDGAAAMVLCLEDEARKHKAKPLCRLIGWGIAGVDPQVMGIGPVPATRMALEMAGIKGHQLDTVELNEAFAPQSLACMKEFETMGIDPEKVNPLGNAIALGHPLGATGAILTVTAAHYLKHKSLTYGLITMCIGGGQGIALVIENLQA